MQKMACKRERAALEVTEKYLYIQLAALPVRMWSYHLFWRNREAEGETDVSTPFIPSGPKMEDEVVLSHNSLFGLFQD